MRWIAGCLLSGFLGCVDFSELNDAPASLDSTSAMDDSSVPPRDTGSTAEDTGSAVEPGEDTGMGQDGPKDDPMEPAGDYTQKGAYIPGNWESALTGTSGVTLYVDVWYPSIETEGQNRYYGWESWGFDGNSFTNIAPDCREPRPVMVHSHGNTSIRWEMFYLPEFLATHGWIVVAPDHAGNTFYDDSADFVELLARRPQDLSDTYDWLVQLSQNPESQFYGCVDEAAGFVVSGYSFGGYTALATAGALVNEGGVPVHDFGDDRVTAVVTFAPWNAYGLLDAGTAEIDVPALTFGAERDDTVGTQYLGLHDPIESEPRALAVLHNGGHYTFTPIYCSFWGDGCGSSYIEVNEFVPMFRTSVLAWLEHLRGRPGAIEQMPAESDELSWDRVD